MITILLLCISLIQSFAFQYKSSRLMGQRCLQNRALSMSFSSVNPFKQATTQLQEIVAKDIVETNDHSELPDSFDDMVQRAASRLVTFLWILIHLSTASRRGYLCTPTVNITFS